MWGRMQASHLQAVAQSGDAAARARSGLAWLIHQLAYVNHI
jgi:hypothetical protein